MNEICDTWIQIPKTTHQKTGRVVQKTPEADSEASLQEMTVLGWKGVVQRETCTFTGKKRVPHKLPLQLLSILAVHQLVYALMDDVGLKQTKKGSQQSEEGGKFRVEKKKNSQDHVSA